MRTTDVCRPRTPRRRAAALVAAAATLVLLTACGGATGDEPEPDGSSAAAGDDLPFVYGVFATPLEEPWDGAIHTALESAADDGTISYEHVDSVETADAMSRTLRDIAENQQPDIIIGDAFAAEDAVREVAAEYPDIAFVFGSGGEEVAPNFSVFDNWMQDPAYLAGMVAGGLTKTGTVGVVGAMPIPEVNRIVNGFIEGVAATNPTATVKVSFINSFFDPATAKQAAQAQIAAGADVLFAERDGVIAAAQENGLPVIGMMVDQQDQAPENVVTSLLWDMRPTIDHVVATVLDGSYEAANLAEFSFMVNGGSSIAPLNAAITGGIPDDLQALVADTQAKIEDGTFSVTVVEDAPAGSVDVTQ